MRRILLWYKQAMRRPLVNLSIAVAAFLMGLSAARLWQAIHPAPKTDQLLAVSFCDLVRDPAKYDRKKVHFAAVLYSDAQMPYLHDISCGSQSMRESLSVAVPAEANLVMPEWAVEVSGCANSRRAGGVAGNVRVSGIFEAPLHAPDSAQTRPSPRIIRGSIYGLWPPSTQLQDPQQFPKPNFP